MTNINLDSLTKAELRAYVISHPEDKDAFHVFVDRFTSEASPETFPVPQSQAEVEEVEKSIRQKVQQSKMSN
jgi:hypothetical protein